MAIGERTWEVLVLLTLSCAACLMMFVGVSNWSDLNQVQVSSQPQGSMVEVPPWIYHDLVVPEVKVVRDEGVLPKARSYFDGFVDFVGSQLGNPLGLWSGEEKMPVQELEDENGFGASVKSFFVSVGDSIKNWGQKTILPPSILHATEPLGRFPHSEIPSTSTLTSKLTAIVGKVMEGFYADSVLAQDAKTCFGIMEEQTRKLVKSLKQGLKEKLCNGEIQSFNEQKFCVFFSSHSTLATLMVFTKLEVDPVGVALMRTTASESCASSDSNMVHSVHKMEKLVRRLRLSSHEVDQHVHEDENEHKHEHLRRGGLQTNHVQEAEACEDCYLPGIQSQIKDIKTRLASICQAPTACMAETCAFVKEHRYLTRTFLVLKIRPWEITSMGCAVSCRTISSYIFPHDTSYYTHTVSHPHAPNLPRLGNGLIRRLDTEHPVLAMDNPDMPVSHPTEFDGFTVRRSYRCRRLARLQAFRRAMQLRGNILGSSDSGGESGLEGNGQAHLVVVVNGHPFGPSNIREIFSDFRNRIDEMAANSHSESGPEPWSGVALLKPFHEHLQTIAEWKDTQSKSDQMEFEGTPEHQAVDSVWRHVASHDAVSDSMKPVEDKPTVESVDEYSSSQEFGDLGESSTLSENSVRSRAAI